MSRGPDDRARGMTPGAARIQALDRRRVGHAAVKAEGVVDVVDVPAGDAEMLFDLRRREWERVDDTRLKPRGELLGDVEQVIDVARFFPLPGLSARQSVWHPLNEEGRIVPAAVVLE